MYLIRYADDINGDANADITVWGTINQSNCLIPYIQSNKTFISGLESPMLFDLTTQPTLIEAIINGNRAYCLVLFNVAGNARVIYEYRLEE